MKNNKLTAGIALYTSSQIRDIEFSYAEQFQEGTYPLMEAAGKSAYLQLKSFWPDARKILVVTGKGNNGGDGFILSRLATEDRKRVTLCNFCPKDKLKNDSLKAYSKLPRSGIRQIEWSELVQDDINNLNQFDVIVDAMLGTGIQGAVRAPFADVIKRINQGNVPVLAIDVPSGLNADTGNLFNCAVKADVTVTFIGHKQGLYTGDSANYCGQVRLLDLSIPSSCYQKHEFSVVAENWMSLKYKLKPRLPTAHKGCYGHCQVIGGVEGMSGAIILAATAAARSGSGLTSAWLESDALSLLARRPEIMAKNIPLEQIPLQLDKLTSVKSLVVGPGLGQTKWSKKWMSLLSNNEQLIDKTKVWDADALNWLAENPSHDELRILTPHPGEAARLLGISSAEINQDRFAASEAIAQKFGGICILKGSGTIISDANGMQVVCAVGNPGMATGGMGDVLSGIIGGLLAQDFSLLDAATLGVCIHGEAADRAAGRGSLHRGMLAGDLFKHLPMLLNP